MPWPTFFLLLLQIFIAGVILWLPTVFAIYLGRAAILGSSANTQERRAETRQDERLRKASRR